MSLCDAVGGWDVSDYGLGVVPAESAGHFNKTSGLVAGSIRSRGYSCVTIPGTPMPRTMLECEVGEPLLTPEEAAAQARRLRELRGHLRSADAVLQLRAAHNVRNMLQGTLSLRGCESRVPA